MPLVLHEGEEKTSGKAGFFWVSFTLFKKKHLPAAFKHIGSG
jgi:hypothetical protein